MVHSLLNKSMRVAGWPHLLALLAVLLVILGISGCRERAGEVTASMFQIDAPEGHFTSVAWTADDTIIAAFEPVSLLNEAMFGLDLWRFSPSGAGFQRLDLPDPDFTYCHSVKFHRPSILRDGRFAFLRECEQDRGFVSELLAGSLETGSVSPLFPASPHTLKFTGYSVAPDGSKALTSLQSGIDDDLTLVTDAGAERVFASFDRANNPSWSPDGDAFVFFGNEELYRDPDPRWAVLSYHFWLVESACQPANPTCSTEPVLLLEYFFPGGRPQWSPDGKWVAFSGVNWVEEEGLFIRNMESGDLVRLASGRYRDLAWAPDGQRLVVIRDKPNFENHRYEARSVLEVFHLAGAPGPTATPSIGTESQGPLPSMSIVNVHAENTSPVMIGGSIVAGSAIDVTFTVRNDGPGDYPAGSADGIPLAVIWIANNSDPRNVILPVTTIGAGEEVAVFDRAYFPPESPLRIDAWLKPIFPTPLGSDAPSTLVSRDFTNLQSADIALGEVALLFNPASAEWTLLVQALNVGNKESVAGVDIDVPVRDVELELTLHFQGNTSSPLAPGACEWAFIQGGAAASRAAQPEPGNRVPSDHAEPRRRGGIGANGPGPMEQRGRRSRSANDHHRAACGSGPPDRRRLRRSALGNL